LITPGTPCPALAAGQPPAPPVVREKPGSAGFEVGRPEPTTTSKWICSAGRLSRPSWGDGDGDDVPKVHSHAEREIRIPHRWGPRPAFYALLPYKKMPVGMTNFDLNVFSRKLSRYEPGGYVSGKGASERRTAMICQRSSPAGRGGQFFSDIPPRPGRGRSSPSY
jgi:hypothetical protein